jgi:Protein of unknown function (DUF2442)
MSGESETCPNLHGFSEMLEVTTAEFLGGHRVRIGFSNGAEGTVDLADALWGPMFEPLQDSATFQRFEISPVLHTLRWENDADLAPEYLYAKMVEQRDAAERGGRSTPVGDPGSLR